MKSSVNRSILVSGILFFIYFINVVLGSMGIKTFLADVSEMLVLFAACIVFVAGILSLEKKEKK